MTRITTAPTYRKLRSSRASRGKNNKKKYNKPSKSHRRKHFKKMSSKASPSKKVTQQTLEVAGELFVTKEEEVEKLQQEINKKNGELGHYKE
ncbi:hypothetical protein RCL_jg4345.t1 [Rhizophagus clarus]|nr:hypothetical protein RCL_jg4345.t1 [Rhizophagus clarus]